MRKLQWGSCAGTTASRTSIRHQKTKWEQPEQSHLPAESGLWAWGRSHSHSGRRTSSLSRDLSLLPSPPRLPQLPLTPRCLLRKEVVGEGKKKHPQQECELRMDEVNRWSKLRDFPLGVGTLEQDENSCRKLRACLSHLDKFWLHHILNYNHMQWEYDDCTLPTFEQGWKYKPTSNAVPFLQDPKTACTNPVVVKFKACTRIIWKACLNMD